jgi:helicase
MKTELPSAHGLSSRLLKTKLIRSVDGKPSLTDAQYLALTQGVGRGASALVIAPTSSGKTDIGLYAAASWLEAGDQMSRKVVYLVSHRALARQKYLELRKGEMLEILNLDHTALVVATGDEIIDGSGEANQDPLDATFLVATYEKFLALLSSSGLRQDMSHYCVVADEVQLIADETRGQDIEILLTLIKAAGFGQFVGLSAVLAKADWTYLAEWLELQVVQVTDREVPLMLELRTPTATHVTTFGKRDRIDQHAPNSALNTVEILKQLAKKPKDHCPVAVFCMTKPRVEELARLWAKALGAKESAAVSNQLDLFDEVSGLSNDLLIYVDNRFGVHTADLLETERALIEDHLDQDKLLIVFATTTLAQGLNYSFQTVLFDKWWRWNYSRKVDEPISKSDFHNMAGRAGRLGKSAKKEGRAIFVADRNKVRAAHGYMSSETEATVNGQIDPGRFDLLALQIVAAGIVDTEERLLTLLGLTLSAHIARRNNQAVDAVWHRELAKALTSLRSWGFIRQ